MEQKLPKHFWIAQQMILVEIKDEPGDVFGYFDTAHNVIVIYTKMQSNYDHKVVELSEEQILNTYYHELFHCFNYFWNTDTDEALAQVFANFMREYERTKVY